VLYVEVSQEKGKGGKGKGREEGSLPSLGAHYKEGKITIPGQLNSTVAPLGPIWFSSHRGDGGGERSATRWHASPRGKPPPRLVPTCNRYRASWRRGWPAYVKGGRSSCDHLNKKEKKRRGGGDFSSSGGKRGAQASRQPAERRLRIGPVLMFVKEGRKEGTLTTA